MYQLEGIDPSGLTPASALKLKSALYWSRRYLQSPDSEELFLAFMFRELHASSMLDREVAARIPEPAKSHG